MDQKYVLIFQVSIATDTEKQLQYYVSIIFKYISDNATQFYMPHRSIISSEIITKHIRSSGTNQ